MSQIDKVVYLPLLIWFWILFFIFYSLFFSYIVSVGYFIVFTRTYYIMDLIYFCCSNSIILYFLYIVFVKTYNIIIKDVLDNLDTFIYFKIYCL